MNTTKLIIRAIAVSIIFLTISSNVFGVLHIIGSFEFQYPTYDIRYRPWIKVKQDLIKRKGLSWLLRRSTTVQVYLMNKDSECGIFTWGYCSSELLVEIKNSLDELSKSNDTITVHYFNPDFDNIHRMMMRPFDFKRYTSELPYRDSIDTDRSEHALIYVTALDRPKRYQKYWFLSDSTLYHAPRCTSLFTYINTDELIVHDELIDEYLAECTNSGYESIHYEYKLSGDSTFLISRSKPLPDWIRDEDADSRPEIQLLLKYITKSDSIILNAPLPKDLYDINFIYDHKKLENAPAMVIGRRTLKELYKDLNKPYPIAPSESSESSRK